MARITLGPVIGKVTSTSARVLIETNEAATVECRASARGVSPVTASVRCPANRPRIIRFEQLVPETDYRLVFKGASAQPDVQGRIRTLPDPCEGLNFGVVSCNKPHMRGTTDLWADLNAKYVDEGDVNYLLHLGDQVYGDDAFAEALGMLGSDTDMPSRRRQDAIKELYRKLYRLTWTHPPTAQALARTANLMIWDDHEIRDDWGSRPTDRAGSNSAEFIVGRLARQVYREYQRQLWDDIDPGAEARDGDEFHHHVFGSIGVIFVDQRGGRSFTTSPAKPYLGTQQWNALKRALKSGGTMADVRALIVATSVPLAYLGTVVRSRGHVVADDLKDHWAYSTHAKEQIEFIRALRTWKEEKEAQRELIVLGGDVHVGGHTDIRHHDETIFKQMITSPITNKPPRWWEFVGLRVLLETNQQLGESYRFEHSDFANRRNYGIVLARGTADREPMIRGSLALEP